MGVEILSRSTGKKVPVLRLKETARRVLELLNQDRAVLSLALVGDREIQELNARYRNKNEPTDVLSFPSGGQFPTVVEILGDVVISVEQAKKQAKKRNRTLEEELETLLIHGILHLLGYDHERSRKEAKIMRGMEKKIHRALCELRALRV
ncbi:MAG: rRNA maturation RNase YbeY [Deltaproteobacteria bacterium]|nr:rRNA maturation RNase YbeY [Deltaproteobacteria bacterium]